MRARRPDPAVGKPDPVAGRPDPGSSSPSPPDPGAGEAVVAVALSPRRRSSPSTPAAAWRPDPASLRRRSSPSNSGSGVEAGSGDVEVRSGLPTVARHRAGLASCPHVTAEASMGPHRMLEHLRQRWLSVHHLHSNGAVAEVMGKSGSRHGAWRRSSGTGGGRSPSPARDSAELRRVVCGGMGRSRR